VEIIHSVIARLLDIQDFRGCNTSSKSFTPVVVKAHPSSVVGVLETVFTVLEESVEHAIVKELGEGLSDKRCFVHW
jgi:hypothetical protein